ncbi:hypothetical protein P171DRAFT_431716 [Karstenula rhodostoma CBS 690.94]|uniref:Uncharacterized protein n=1 Tax=Karstenula rhodostoma CBS 690.94 TaxID=1392251 RepID=A0A9P4PKM7_9PLEO|nr:hypothetical protein P171DRAFT_431716 [Karstenula rhodostoma CBS 690.94]
MEAGLHILEGSGCPAGTYHAQPIEPGKSLNTYVDFDPSVFLFNSTTTPAPVTCTTSVNFEFTYPEDDQVSFETTHVQRRQVEERDVDRGTNFIFDFKLLANAGDEVLDVRIKDEGPKEFDVSGVFFPVGIPGEVGVGTFHTEISISTDFGPGESSVSRMILGFGLFEVSE